MAVAAASAGVLVAPGAAAASPSGPQVPAAVLAPPQVSGTSVTLTWTDQSPDEEEFWVFRRNAAGGPFSYVVSVGSTSTPGTGAAYSVVDTIPAGTRQCYAVTTYIVFGRAGEEFSNEQCTSALPRLPVPAAGPGGFHTVDVPGPPPEQNAIRGIDPSGVIGRDGLAVFASSTHGASRHLRITHCRDEACTSVSAISLDTLGETGYAPAMAIGGDGLPVVAYASFDASFGSTHTKYDLKVAKCTSVTCGSGGSRFVDRASTVRRGIALAIGPDGFPLISYLDEPSDTQPAQVKVIHCLDHSCQNKRESVVDTVGTGDRSGTAITVLPTGLALVAYTDGTPHGDLKVARCHNSDCSASTAVTVDAAGTSGRQPSITVGRDGLAIIAHERTDPDGKVVVSRCVNVLCTATTNSVLDTTGSLGATPSIAIGADGFPVVAYSHPAGPSLRVARCENVACTAATRSTVETSAGLGWLRPSVLVAPDGRPVVGYWRESEAALRVVDCGNVLCRPPFG
ncbi:hypothetical protein Psuf_012860 [Phytohabitans suffuscus]|uniref:Fibronectin type-III domain-containing protein n=1 Tax=Phytohabitans suffuscus TaxID=624315 RepID=A0A6F8YD67_9ACTN|nr:hypothetical protein [Phytohabitans suffuscus]BCB83973.1 hypothetical protein Psuf_012860 [Phytohabitans suffuscus]